MHVSILQCIIPRNSSSALKMNNRENGIVTYTSSTQNTVMYLTLLLAKITNGGCIAVHIYQYLYESLFPALLDILTGLLI